MAPKRRIDDEEFVKSVITAIENGATPEVAARAQGVSVSSWYEWKTKARTDERFGEFFALIDQAEAISEIEDILTTKVASQTLRDATFCCPKCKYEIEAKSLKMFSEMQRALTDAAKTALERLSRRFPRRWAAVSRIQVEDEQREFLDRLERVLDPEVFRMVLEICASEDGGTAPTNAPEGAGLH